MQILDLTARVCWTSRVSAALLSPLHLTDPDAAEPVTTRNLGSDAQSQPEAPAHPIDETPTLDCNIELNSDHEQDDDLLVRLFTFCPVFHTYIRTQPDSDVEHQQPRCEDLHATAKGKEKAVEPDSDDESLFSDDDRAFDDDDGDDSMWGGDSDVSEERAVPPPARPLKRSATELDEDEDDDEDEAPTPKRHKSVSYGISDNDDIIIIDSSDDDMPTPVTSLNHPGPSTSRPRSSATPTAHKKTVLRERTANVAALKRWRSELRRLWKHRREMDREVSKNGTSVQLLQHLLTVVYRTLIHR